MSKSEISALIKARAEAASSEGFMNLVTTKHKSGETSYRFTWSNVNNRRFHKSKMLDVVKGLAANNHDIACSAVYNVEDAQKAISNFVKDKAKSSGTKTGFGIPAKLILACMESKKAVWSVEMNSNTKSDREPQIVFGKKKGYDKQEKGKAENDGMDDLDSYLSMVE